jgi:uncharacterized protein YjbI with pentapeptide repeats
MTAQADQKPRRSRSRLRIVLTLGLIGVVVFCLVFFVQVWRCPPLCLGMNITGRDFRNREIDVGIFTNAVAKGADFSGATLDQLVFTGADLSGAQFQGAQMLETDLSDTILIGADFSEANLSASIFDNADLRGADFTSANLTGVDLTQTKSLTATRFDKAKLVGANLNGTDLTGSQFSQANLNGADLTSGGGAHRSRFIRSDLRGHQHGWRGNGGCPADRGDFHPGDPGRHQSARRQYEPGYLKRDTAGRGALIERKYV